MLHDNGHIAHAQQDTFGSGTQDVEWLPQVGARGWILLTKDKQIRKREIELRALRQAGVRAFVLTAAGLTGAEQARVLEAALPAMLRLLRRYLSHTFGEFRLGLPMYSMLPRNGASRKPDTGSPGCCYYRWTVCRGARRSI